MYNQILDSYRQAAESTMQLQQSMLRNWAQQWPQMVGTGGGPGPAWLEQAQAAQKKWSESVTAMLNKHRELLDSQYKTGIKLIEESFRVGEAKDPEQLRRLVEELWKHGLQSLKTVTEEQMREFQSVMQSWMELVSQGTSALKS